VNGETPRNATISFDFLDKGKNTWLRFMLMQRGALQNQPTSLFNSKIAVTNKSKISQLFSSRGGYASA
jgi:hypothetical protein